ncbi:MAG: LPS-assembly protein LptD [Calditrichaeota bacterium]|nr:LPS-assembly protein LptD [Calditrichota bacterium]
MLKILILFIIVPVFIFGQSVVSDSLAAVNDTTITTADSTAAKPKPKSAIQDKIPYKADHIGISVDGNSIFLSGNAEIRYQNLKLTAEKITIDKKNNKLYAQGVLDSVDAKGNKVYRGNPVFEEKGQEPMYGNRIEYDFETKRGKIDIGRTNMEPGYYKGTDIYKIADSTLLVEDGYFTTCELPDHPHYYFRSDEMRLRFKDKVVARPIYFYIADIPLAALPFGIFPNKGGRHSGLVIPSYGENRHGGRFLNDFGYYWAPNDYFDATMLADYYEDLGFTYKANTRYRVRYKLSGGINGEYYPKDPTTGLRRERWRFSFSHSQTIDQTFTINGSGSFQSDKNFRKDTSPNVNDRLNQNITSSLTINKSFKGTLNSVSASFSSNQNLQTEESDYTFPRISFNRRQSSLYETITGNTVGASRSWYQNIYFSYNSTGLRRGSHKLVDRNNPDTTFVDDERMGINHRMSFNSPQKVLKYFSLNPSVNYNEVWVDEVNKGHVDEETGEITESREKQFAIRRTFDANMNFRTKVYGLFEPNIGELKFIRHIIDPSVTMTWAPNFADPSYGYYERFYEGDSLVRKVDKFKGSLFGGTPTGESQRMTISLGNLFQAKFIDDEGKEEKVDFFKANFSTSYNFLADSLRWGTISSNYSTKILGQNISARATHNLYAYNSRGQAINKFFYENGDWFPRLTNFNTSFGYTIDNKTFEAKESKEKGSRRKSGSQTEKDKNAAESDADSLLTNDLMFDSSLNQEKQITKKIELPWSVAFRLNYSYSKPAADATESINLSTTANFKLSKNWKVRWQANFDMAKQDLVYQSFNIYRDLHCWEMSFNWQPSQKYYSFQINIKEPTLQDIKLTKHPRSSPYAR